MQHRRQGEPLLALCFGIARVLDYSLCFFTYAAGLEIRGILVANATMFSHLLPGFSCGSKHLLLP